MSIPKWTIADPSEAADLSDADLAREAGTALHLGVASPLAWAVLTEMHRRFSTDATTMQMRRNDEEEQ